MTPAARTLRAKLAAHSLHAQGKTNTKPATEAFMRKFEKEVDPDGTLPPDERRKRAEHARRAHMARLALKSAQARASR